MQKVKTLFSKPMSKLWGSSNVLLAQRGVRQCSKRRLFLFKSAIQLILKEVDSDLGPLKLKLKESQNGEIWTIDTLSIPLTCT